MSIRVGYRIIWFFPVLQKNHANGQVMTAPSVIVCRIAVLILIEPSTEYHSLKWVALHSFLQRLERKGLVTRDRSSFVHVFSPTASHADVLGQELKVIAERLGAARSRP